MQEGDVTRALKGTLSIGQTRTQTLPTNDTFAAYNIVEGLGKPLVEGNLVTVTVDAENVNKDNVYIESFDGVRSVLTVDPITDVLDRRTKRLISVHELRGVGPYRVIVTNIDNFVVRLDKGDLLTNNKGSIVVGQTVRDSSRAPQYLIYTLAPELGKQLVEGDIVTVNFLNQANTDKPFFNPVVRDGKENAIPFKSNIRCQCTPIYWCLSTGWRTTLPVGHPQYWRICPQRTDRQQTGFDPRRQLNSINPPTRPLMARSLSITLLMAHRRSNHHHQTWIDTTWE